MFMNYNLLAIIHDCDVTLHAAGAIFVYMINSNEAPRYLGGFYFKTTCLLAKISSYSPLT